MCFGAAEWNKWLPVCLVCEVLIALDADEKARGWLARDAGEVREHLGRIETWGCLYGHESLREDVWWAGGSCQEQVT